MFVAITWRKLHESGWLEFAGRRPKPEHLLWALNWMKSYNTEDIGASLAGVDEKTYREKVWFYLEGIARLDTTIVSPCCRVSVASHLLTFSRSPLVGCTVAIFFLSLRSHFY